ncbi:MULTISPECIES: 23S rRNA (uracil(1939)-C(5))-methyltransferase RlmD [Helcococcus]|uniref:23S rRNA (Uracil(1939)-C(5))-methyltransferase RlmD n=1 Tax=Helcococcus bovis TaxID=3153252 RepID=A0ABW9F8Q0_9FIRM
MENILLEIIDIDDNGRGVAKLDGMIYFVENAKYGETIEATIIKEKKSFIIAKKIKTVKKSPFLENTSITEKQLCGVYDLFDIEYSKQVELKKNNIINTINRIAGESLNDINFFEADNRYGYRNKIELKVSLDGKLSSFNRNSYDLVNIENCVMTTSEISDVIKKLQDLIFEYNLKGYDSSTGEGLIKNVIIRSTSFGETMVIFVLNKEYNLKNFYIALESSNILTSFYVSMNAQKNNYKIKDLVHVFGKKKIIEQLGEYKFNISPKAFFQVNKNMSYKIYLEAQEYIKSLKPKTIVDLYSGVSTTSIILSKNAEKIISVEINKDAVKDARENAKLNNIENIEWMDIPAEVAIDEIELDDEKTVALFDPPRKGLDKNIIKKIGESKINNLIYISCNPSTLARDIKLFKEYGFRLLEVTGIDQFVNTVEIEALILLARS